MILVMKTINQVVAFYARVASTPSIVNRARDYRLQNAVTNEVLTHLLSQGGMEGVEVQLWTQEINAPASELGRGYYDVVRIKFTSLELVVSIPTPLLTESVLVSLQPLWQVVNHHKFLVAVGAFNDRDENQGEVKVTIYPDQNNLWKEFVDEFLTDEDFTNLVPQTVKVLKEKVRKVRRNAQQIAA